MFSSSKDLFKGRQCPSVASGKFCRLLCCPFDHPERFKRDAEPSEGERVKRRKLEEEPVDRSLTGGKPEERETQPSKIQPDSSTIASSGVEPGKRDEDQTTQHVKTLADSTTRASSASTSASSAPRTAPPKSASSTTTASPTTTTASTKTASPTTTASSSTKPRSALDAVKSSTQGPVKTPQGPTKASQGSDAEHLMPTTIFPCPATVPQRITYLKAIFTALTEKRKLKFPKRAAILEELGAAKRSAGNYMVYTNECRVLVKSIRDGSWRGGGAKEAKPPASNDMTASISNQLNTMATNIKPLLAQNGYPVNPTPSRSGLSSNIGIQHCDRCNKAFDVPKVDNYGSCKYHWARPRLGGNANMPEKFYPCCNQPVGASEGCEEAPRHVYKLHDLNDLAFVIPFRKVPEKSGSEKAANGSKEQSGGNLMSSLGLGGSKPAPPARRPRTVFNGPAVASREPDITLENMKSEKPDAAKPNSSVVAVDCEMLYTTLGMELCRVTCIDYTGKKTLDRVVRPTGRILDFNTRFSGISDLDEQIITETGERGPSVSFEEAHKLIFALVSPSTILVGHGLENDLIAMRLIHDRIIDTSILYPDFNPKYKTALKTLALKYLKRTIQTGEHDSMEDALAALDVVKYHLKK